MDCFWCTYNPVSCWNSKQMEITGQWMNRSREGVKGVKRPKSDEHEGNSEGKEEAWNTSWSPLPYWKHNILNNESRFARSSVARCGQHCWWKGTEIIFPNWNVPWLLKYPSLGHVSSCPIQASRLAKLELWDLKELTRQNCHLTWVAIRLVVESYLWPFQLNLRRGKNLYSNIYTCLRVMNLSTFNRFEVD